MTTFPVDAVYTWVDGSDPKWLRKKRQALEQHGRRYESEEVSGEERFRNNGELRYSVRSVLKFAPWIRKVFIVTDEQVPDWLDTSSERVEMVDHKDIFDDASVLPTFSARAIEMRLHHIDGLSERFLYFNDDYFLGRPASVSDFFRRSGMGRHFTGPRLRRTFPSRLLLDSAVKKDNPHRRAVQNARLLIHERFGYVASYDLRHCVKVCSRRVHSELEAMFPEEFERTLSHPFRENTDVLIMSLAAYYEMAALGNRPHAVKSLRGDLKRYSIGPMRRNREYVIVSLSDHSAAKIRSRLDAVRKYGPLMFCINDGPGASREKIDLAMGILEEFLPEPSEAELT